MRGGPLGVVGAAPGAFEVRVPPVSPRFQILVRPLRGASFHIDSLSPSDLVSSVIRCIEDLQGYPVGSIRLMINGSRSLAPDLNLLQCGIAKDSSVWVSLSLLGGAKRGKRPLAPAAAAIPVKADSSPAAEVVGLGQSATAALLPKQVLALRLWERGLVRHDVLGDGNCLPRAFALYLYNDESRHEEVRFRGSHYVRNLVGDEAAQLLELFQQELSGERDLRSLSEYADILGTNEVWLGSIDAEVFRRAFGLENMDIHIATGEDFTGLAVVQSLLPAASGSPSVALPQSPPGPVCLSCRLATTGTYCFLCCSRAVKPRFPARSVPSSLSGLPSP